MALEIEDKYLIKCNKWRTLVTESTHISQTYMLGLKSVTIRTRIDDNRPAILCVKLADRKNGTPEYEWRIPTLLARLCSMRNSRTLEKIRHRVPWHDVVIEVDEFLGSLQGLVVAEVELPSRDHTYPKPDWFGQNVTADKRYKNAVLVRNGIPT